jgi:hypothetical protein
MRASVAAPVKSQRCRGPMIPIAALGAVAYLAWIGTVTPRQSFVSGRTGVVTTANAPPLCTAASELHENVVRKWADQKQSPPCTFSEGFPSLGGPGCPCPCVDKSVSGSSATVYWRGDHDWSLAFSEQVAAALLQLREFGPLISTDADHGSNRLRIVLAYHCCVGKRAWPTIKSAADSFPWRALRVRFGPLTCSVSSDAPDKVDLILPLESESSLALEEEAYSFWKHLSSHSDTYFPRARVLQHHMSLAVVNASMFPVSDALEAINANIHDWTGQKGVELHRARCHLCDKLVSRQRARTGS